MKKRIKKRKVNPKASKKAQDKAAKAFADAIKKAALEGVGIVTKKAASMQDVTLPMLVRMTLEDVLNSAFDVGQANLAGITKNCSLCVMAAYQLGRTGATPDFLPGEAVPVLIRSVMDIPEDDQVRNTKISASLTASVVSKVAIAGENKARSVRLHLWVAYLFGKERGVMDRGLS